MKTNDFIEKYKGAMIGILFLMLIVQTCNVHSMKRSLNELKTKHSKTLTIEDIQSIINQQTKDLLRLEEDIDNKTKTVEDVMAEIDKE